MNENRPPPRIETAIKISVASLVAVMNMILFFLMRYLLALYHDIYSDVGMAASGIFHFLLEHSSIVYLYPFAAAFVVLLAVLFKKINVFYLLCILILFLDLASSLLIFYNFSWPFLRLTPAIG